MKTGTEWGRNEARTPIQLHIRMGACIGEAMSKSSTIVELFQDLDHYNKLRFKFSLWRIGIGEPIKQTGLERGMNGT